DGDLRRAEHVPGRMQAHARAAERHRLAVAHRLRGAGEIFAVAQPHQVERLRRSQHRAMARARVVGMAVGDYGLVDWPGWIDVEAAKLAAYAGGGRNEDIFRPHSSKIGHARLCGRLWALPTFAASLDDCDAWHPVDPRAPSTAPASGATSF